MRIFIGFFAIAFALAVPLAGAAVPAPSAADRASILRSLKITADALGQVENECGEKVAPQFLVADLGGAVGTAILFVMTSGPNSAACYGDGPNIQLMMREGAGWREIYSSRGGYLAILKTKHAGVNDIAFAGPGFDHPLWAWNGTEYAPTKRTVADAQMKNATILP